MWYRILIKPMFFLFNPEKAHYLAMGLLTFVGRIPGVKWVLRKTFTIEHPSLSRQVFGLHFRNPVGLAAGFDKNAQWVDELDSLGFGFVEIGTVTPLPQPGNDKPRLFRLPADHALINRMGFNNAGATAAAFALKKRKSSLIVGGNIGKNKITPNDQALQDYLLAYDALYDVVDYFVVNVSSPNTPGLRQLQEKEPLMNILGQLQQTNGKRQKPKPILLKIAPDLTNDQLDDIIDIVIQTKIAGVIATNTTIERSNLKTPAAKVQQIGAGGLSGKPVAKRSTEVIRYLKQHSNNAFPVIGAGGIHSPQDAHEKLNAGADLIQVYTGFIYEGPSLAKNINASLIK